MKPVRALLAMALCLAAAAAAHAAAKKPSAVSIRFYPEAGAEGGEFSQKVSLLQSGRATYMGEIPIISDSDVQSYQSFPAQDGSGTFGTYLKLDGHGSNLLAQHTMSRRGSYVLVFFNGRHVVDLYVDKAVQDGIAVIPNGLTAHDIELLAITYPKIGHEGEKPEAKPTPKKSKAKSKPGATATPAPSAQAAGQGMPHVSQAVVRQPDGTFAPATSSGQSGTVMPNPLDAAGQPQ